MNESAPAQSDRRRPWHRTAGLAGGPLLALVVYMVLPKTFPDAAGETVEFTEAGRATLAVMTWMGLWWLTEAIDVAATALVPIAVFPLLGIASIRDATAPYARDLIFLFMGGFLLALSMQRWSLDRRIALTTLRLFGTRPRNMVAGFMTATAVMSAFVSNTATTAMMMPIALSVVALVRGGSRDAGGERFATCLMLAVAYAASIGGVATIIGSPPNGIVASFIANDIGPAWRREIGFIDWLKIGLPLVVLFLPITWLLLTRFVYPVGADRIEGGRTLVDGQLAALGPTGRGEWITLVVFLITAGLWIFRKMLTGLSFEVGGRTIEPLSGLSDAGIAILAGLALFVIPVDRARGEFAMNWETAARMPWGVFILFGGGLSLAAAVDANGVATFLGSLTSRVGGVPPVVLVLLVTTAVIFLTELASNTATTATLVPVLAGLAPGLGVSPYLLIVPAAIAASCAFMMPVATPPNAIVFGTGHITIPQMCRAGIWLNLIGIALITTMMYVVVMRVL